MSEHTPGPWKVFSDRGRIEWICAGRHKASSAAICLMAPCAHDVLEEQNANARLIAAAPELLAECKAAVADAATAVNPSARLPNFDAMKAAIAKAEPKESEVKDETI